MDANPGKPIFVRAKMSNRFLNRECGWVGRFDEAARFESVMEAVEFCFKKRVSDAEIVRRMGEPRSDVKTDAVLTLRGARAGKNPDKPKACREVLLFVLSTSVCAVLLE